MLKKGAVQPHARLVPVTIVPLLANQPIKAIRNANECLPYYSQTDEVSIFSSLHFATSSEFHWPRSLLPLPPHRPHGNGSGVFPNDHLNTSSVRVSFFSFSFFFFLRGWGRGVSAAFILAAPLWGPEMRRGSEWMNAAESTQSACVCVRVRACMPLISGWSEAVGRGGDALRILGVEVLLGAGEGKQASDGFSKAKQRKQMEQIINGDH